MSGSNTRSNMDFYSAGLEAIVVEIFHFRIWSIPEGRYQIPQFKATREYIKKNYGKTVAGTKEDVPLDAIDEFGRYFAQGRRDALASRT